MNGAQLVRSSVALRGLSLAGSALVAGIGCASNTIGVDGESGTSGDAGEDTSTTTSTTTPPPPTPGSSTSGADTTTGPTSSTGAGCTADTDCEDPEAPLCVEGQCVACTEVREPDARCEARGPDAPVCDAGACVACPDAVCPAEHAACGCTACTSNDDCSAGAGCDVGSGVCLTDVLYVDDHGRCPGDGSEAVPYCLPQDAIEAVGVGGSGTIRIVPGVGAGYAQDLSVLAGQTLVLIGDGEYVPNINAEPGGAPSVLTIAEPDATVWATGLRFRGGTDGPAIEVSGGSLHASAIQIADSEAGGIVVDGGSAELTNSFIAHWWSQDHAIFVDSGSFVGRNISVVWAQTASGAVFCTSAATVHLHDSIVVSLATVDDFVCQGVVLDHVVTKDDVGPPPITAPPWFENQFGGDLHLRPDGAAVFADLADWNTGDPTVDIDGDPRPRVDGTPDFPGADVPVMR